MQAELKGKVSASSKTQPMARKFFIFDIVCRRADKYVLGRLFGKRPAANILPHFFGKRGAYYLDNVPRE